MKKLICCLLVLSMLIPIYGCSGNGAIGSDGTSGGETPVAEYTVYDKPTFTPGTLESDLLTVQTGNFDRASRTSDGLFVEIGSGYYLQNGRVYFADREDLTQWVLFCNAPDCKHDIGCSSSVGRIFLNDESRLCFLVPTANYAYLAGIYAKK